MGEFADLAIEQGFEQWIDEGCPNYVWEEKKVLVEFEYEKQIDETLKAWKLKFKNGWEQWFPKSKCSLKTIKISRKKRKHLVCVPKWLIERKEMLVNLSINFNKIDENEFISIGKRKIEV